MLDIVQINLKKAFVATVELNRKIKNLNRYVALTTEPYKFNGKIRSVPPKANTICDTDPRAAIIYGGGLELIKVDHLTSRDFAVGLLKTKTEKILIASVYLDIKEAVVQQWLEDFIEFANKKNYPVLIGMDSNAHSTLYGPDSNRRGEMLEEFIINNSLHIENIGTSPTFEAFRREGLITSVIDVTLTKGLKEDVVGWKVCREYNLSLIHI